MMLQPLKDLSSNIVTLAFSIYNFDQLDGSYTSDMKEEHGVFWCVRVQSNKTAKSQKRRVSIFLQCCPKNPGSNWGVIASFGFRIMNSYGQCKNKISSLFYHSFTARDSSKGSPSFMSWDELTTPANGFLVDGTFQIEFDLNVTACTGIKRVKLSKDVFEKFIADGKLIVDDKEIIVCLPLLAEHSVHLYKMFYLDNPGGEKTFEIFDFTHEAVQGMVSILQQDNFDVTISNYRELLELAEAYEIFQVLDKCEEFLLKCKKISSDTKLKLSEIFRLHILQFRTMESIKSTEHCERILDENMDLGDETYEALVEKLKYLKFQDETANSVPSKCKCSSDKCCR